MRKKLTSAPDQFAMRVALTHDRSVTLVGKDLQFIVLEDGKRIRSIVTNDALKRLAKSVKELRPQENFQAY